MYASLSIKPGKKSIAKIVKKNEEGNEIKDKDAKEQCIDLVFTDNRDDVVSEIKLDDSELVCKPLWTLHDGDCQNRVYIAGQSFCGKSYFAKELADDFNTIFPKAKVAYFSAVEEDKNLNEKNVKNFNKINCESCLEEPFSLEEFHDKLCIFDDIAAFPDKKLVKELEKFAVKCVNTGRHHHIGTIICRQKLLAGHETSDILNGCFQCVVFPKTASRFQLQNYLDRYFKFPKELIKKICDVPSRWVLINTSNPVYILHQKGCFLV